LLSLFDIEIVFQKLCTCRHILAAVHFNFNLQRDVKQREADGVERIKVSYPKFKNGEATVRDVRITQNFGKPLGLFMRVCHDHSPASLVLQKLLMVSYYVVMWLLFNGLINLCIPAFETPQNCQHLISNHPKCQNNEKKSIFLTLPLY